MSDFPQFLNQSSQVVASRLLGCIIEREINGTIVSSRIVETEAYDQTDEASHSFRGETARTSAMFGVSGHAYIYFTYGMHYCFNIVTGDAGHGSGVLIRAVQPIDNIQVMRINRPGRADTELTNGPAKLTQALNINHELYGHNLRFAPLKLKTSNLASGEGIVQTTRIGIRVATDKMWRFYIENNPYISKK